MAKTWTVRLTLLLLMLTVSTSIESICFSLQISGSVEFATATAAFSALYHWTCLHCVDRVLLSRRFASRHRVDGQDDQGVERVELGVYAHVAWT
jgi:hypothetical protein